MKILAGLILMLSGANVFAAKDPCTTFLSCGTYKMESSYEGHAYVTFITIAATGEKTASFTYKTSTDGGELDGWDLSVNFEDNGSFTMLQKNKNGSERNYANGICSDGICSYGQHPWKPVDAQETIANAGMIRFHGDKLEYVMIFGTPTDSKTGLQVFTRQ